MGFLERVLHRAGSCAQCGREAPHVCGRCQLTSYCGKACQTAHWNAGEHPRECQRIAQLIGNGEEPEEQRRRRIAPEDEKDFLEENDKEKALPVLPPDMANLFEKYLDQQDVMNFRTAFQSVPGGWESFRKRILAQFIEQKQFLVTSEEELHRRLSGPLAGHVRRLKVKYTDGLTVKQIQELAFVLRGNANIISLDLSANGIGPEGARALARGNFPRLQKLDLWNNEIGAEGAAALARGNFPKLQTLDLEDNRIGDEGRAALAKLEQKSPGLKIHFFW